MECASWRSESSKGLLLIIAFFQGASSTGNLTIGLNQNCAGRYIGRPPKCATGLKCEYGICKKDPAATESTKSTNCKTTIHKTKKAAATKTKKYKTKKAKSKKTSIMPVTASTTTGILPTIVSSLLTTRYSDLPTSTVETTPTASQTATSSSGTLPTTSAETIPAEKSSVSNMQTSTVDTLLSPSETSSGFEPAILDTVQGSATKFSSVGLTVALALLFV